MAYTVGAAHGLYVGLWKMVAKCSICMYGTVVNGSPHQVWGVRKYILINPLFVAVPLKGDRKT